MSDDLSELVKRQLVLSDSKMASKLGVQLVDILYSNTKLNYDVCAFNLVGVFQHLRSQVPELASISRILIESIEVCSL